MRLEIIALIISSFSLGWNIYRDVIIKPRLKVQFSVSTLFHPTFVKPLTKLPLKATNFGPGKIKLQSIYTKETSLLKWMLRREEYAYVVHDFEDPISSTLPTVLDVGDTIDLFLPYTRDSFLAGSYTHIGILDSFGRTHWATSKQVMEARRAYMKDFG
jgi:hypothetical protein